MTSLPSKSIPFIVMFIVCGFMAVDIFTPYTVEDSHIQLLVMFLTPLGLGGLVNKGWNVYRDVKKKEVNNHS